nr:MAG: replication associated protein [Cressdnaviricota sp.]
MNAWCFRISNPTIQDDPKDWPGIQYIVYQLEQGAGGLIHFQGYCYVKERCGLKKMKELNNKAHWEIRNGTHEQAVHYCKKPVDGCQCQHCVPPQPRLGGPWEFGAMREGQGKRTDLLDLQKDLELMIPIKEIAKTHFSNYLRYGRGIRMYRELQIPVRNWETVTRVYWGPTNIGKSRRASFEAPEAFYLMKSRDKNSSWWNGYEGQENVIINDFYGWLPYDELLRICDRYPHQVEYKGGSVNFCAKLIIITSNKHPSLWYNCEKLRVEYETLGRRLQVIGMMDNWTEEMSPDFIGPRQNQLLE